MKAFIVRQIPDDLWVKVKARAKSEGRSLRFIVTQLLERYVKHGLDAE